MNLLFADDDNILREGYIDFLNIFFDNIYQASNGQEAWEVYKKNSIDVVLMDINMPKLSGLEVIKKIREKDSVTKVIVISSYDDKEYLFQAIELGLESYMMKPIEKDTFIKIISKIKKDTPLIKQNIIMMPDNFTWNNQHQLLYKDDEPIKLTKMEIEIFKSYCNYNQQVFSYVEVYNLLYENDDDFSENKIRMLIKRLRKKVGKNIIDNIYGLGYRFNIQSKNQIEAG